MVVPHIAVVSSLLLAGNNPNIWEGITSQSSLPTLDKIPDKEEDSHETLEHSKGIQFIYYYITGLMSYLQIPVYGPTYDSRYQPAWMWDRGNAKALWVAKLAEKKPHLHKALDSEVLSMGFRSWCLYTAVPAMILLIIPSALGGMVRYVSSLPIAFACCHSYQNLVIRRP